MTIKDIFFESHETMKRTRITGSVIPKFIPSPFIKAPVNINVSISKIGVDPYPRIRKNLVIAFSDGTEKKFHESTSNHRNITIILP